MSQGVLFAIGSVLFIATAWAAVAFGLSRMHQLRLEQMRESGLDEVSASGLTSRYVETARSGDESGG